MSVVGRGEQTGSIRELFLEGNGGAAVRADHGIGLTTFVDDLHERAAELELTVLSGSGRRSESHLTLALLRELAAADPAGDLAHALNALDGTDATEALFHWARDAGPTAIVVDDVHLADEVSVEALEFLARRTAHTSVVTVIGTHGDTDLPTIDLPPLTIDELMATIDDRFPGTDEAVTRRVAQLADGSPLVAIEVTRSLDDPQRRGEAPLPSFPVTAAPITHVFDEAVRALPDETRRVLCVAAAEPTGELRVVAGAAAALGDTIEALAAAEDAGIVEIDDGIVRFDHAIRRSVAYRQLAAASRRAAHRALASVLDAPADAERRAAHLAAGVIQPDERLAADLEHVAEAAERRRDHLEAARWWAAAARLSPGAHEADRRQRRATTATAPRPDPIAGLTKAERRVAAVVGTGATNKAAAATLFVSVKTVDAHLQSIYRKLGISSRAELAVLMTQLDADPTRTTGVAR